MQQFQLRLMENILDLHYELKNKTYKHSAYEHFVITDPKPRDIHKASVRDRLLHHAIHRVLYPYFDNLFMTNSYSCRLNKGNHKAVDMFRAYAFVASANHTKSLWVLKCDVKRFFASVDHTVLKSLLKEHIDNVNTNWLLEEVIDSFQTKSQKGLPLGNLTSQLLVNIYLNELDQYIKRVLKAKHYIRFADDFVILNRDRKFLESSLIEIERFLFDKLKLEIHPNKVFIKTLASGVDFLGWVHFQDHRIPRAATRRRIARGVTSNIGKVGVVQSYMGLLSHGNTNKLKRRLFLV